MRIAALQHDIVWMDRDANFARLDPLIGAAADGGAEMVVLSEMFSTGFAVREPNLGEPEGGPSSQFLVDQARSRGIVVGGSCPEIPADSDPDDHRPANVFVLAGPDGVIARYRKIHPFSYGGEHLLVRPGADTLTVPIGGLRVSPFVCYDVRFADSFWGLAAGTDVYLVVANWPDTRRHHWMTLLVARAIENQAYVVGVNRTGGLAADRLRYVGDSMIVDPFGEVLAQADDAEGPIFADIDAEHVASVRGRFPFMDDR